MQLIFSDSRYAQHLLLILRVLCAHIDQRLIAEDNIRRHSLLLRDHKAQLAEFFK